MTRSLHGSQVRSRSESTVEPVATDDQYRCPLCAETHPAESRLYVHLQTDHRKSTLADALLEMSCVENEPE